MISGNCRYTGVAKNVSRYELFFHRIAIYRYTGYIAHPYNLVPRGRIDGVRKQLSPQPWTPGVKLSLGPNASEFRGTGDPESGPVRISFDSE